MIKSGSKCRVERAVKDHPGQVIKLATASLAVLIGKTQPSSSPTMRTADAGIMLLRP